MTFKTCLRVLLPIGGFLPLFFSAAPSFAGDIAGVITEQGTGFLLNGIDLDLFDEAGVSVPTTAKSDVTGQYSIPGLPAGNYILRADPSTAQGYVDQYYPGVFLRVDAGLLAVPSLGTVTVDFALAKGASISGTVTIAGSGAMAQNIDLDVFTDAGHSVDSVNAKTDALGFYTIGSFPAGNYVVRADPDPTQFLVRRYYINADRLSLADRIAVSGLTTITNIDMQVPPGGVIRGIVSDNNSHAALSGVTINLFDSMGVLQLANATTSATGFYELGAVIPGTYHVQARPPALTGYIPAFHPSSFLETGASPVTVTANVITSNINVGLSHGGTMSGSILASGTMAPIPNVLLSVTDSAGTRMPVSAKSDATGGYTIGGFPAGQYRVRARPPTALGYADEFYSEKVLEVSGDLVTVSVGNNTPNINFTLDRAAFIEGVITAAGSGVPLAGIDLDLYTQTKVFYSPADGVTSATGFYRMGPVPPGTWLLQADPTVAQGYVDEYYNGAYGISEAAPVTVIAGQLLTNINLVLDTGGSISGTIRLASNNQPFAGCDLDVFALDHRRIDVTAKSDVNGIYTLGLIPAGQVLVRADPPNASGLAEEFYNDVPDITSANSVMVTVGGTTSMIDFHLVPLGAATPTPTATHTPLPPTPSPTSTATNTPPGPTPTATSTPSSSATGTSTASPTITNTPGGPTETVTDTPLPPTNTPTPSQTDTPSPSATPSITDTPGGPTPTPDGDLNGDNLVNAADLLLLIAQWKNHALDPGHPADYTGDGLVGPDDLLFLLVRWKTAVGM
jgi:hypothetical protein